MRSGGPTAWGDDGTSPPLVQPDAAGLHLAQQVIGVHQGQFRLHHRHGPRQHAGIIAALGGASRLCRDMDQVSDKTWERG